jgi:hypothetical protein
MCALGALFRSRMDSQLPDGPIAKTEQPTGIQVSSVYFCWTREDKHKCVFFALANLNSDQFERL